MSPVATGSYGHTLLARWWLVLTEVGLSEPGWLSPRRSRSRPRCSRSPRAGWRRVTPSGCSGRKTGEQQRSGPTSGPAAFAYNWALSQVRSELGARKADRAHVSVGWDLYSLRKLWNSEKLVVAPLVGGKLERGRRNRYHRLVRGPEELAGAQGRDTLRWSSTLIASNPHPTPGLFSWT